MYRRERIGTRTCASRDLLLFLAGRSGVRSDQIGAHNSGPSDASGRATRCTFATPRTPFGPRRCLRRPEIQILPPAHQDARGFMCILITPRDGAVHFDVLNADTRKASCRTYISACHRLHIADYYRTPTSTRRCPSVNATQRNVINRHRPLLSCYRPTLFGRW